MQAGRTVPRVRSGGCEIGAVLIGIGATTVSTLNGGGVARRRRRSGTFESGSGRRTADKINDLRTCGIAAGQCGGVIYERYLKAGGTHGDSSDHIWGRQTRSATSSRGFLNEKIRTRLYES